MISFRREGARTEVRTWAQYVWYLLMKFKRPVVLNPPHFKKSSPTVGREEMRKQYVQSRDSAARGGTAHRAGAGGDDTGGAIASGVAGDPATHWAQAAARAAAAGATARGAAAAGDAGAAALAAHRLATPGPAAGDVACRPAAAGATAGPTAGGAVAARDAAGGARAGGLAADGAVAAGHTTAGAVAGGPAAGGLAVAGPVAGLLAETSATALVRADGATTGADHGVRGWRFWVSFQESEFLESESLLGPQPTLYPAEELLS